MRQTLALVAILLAMGSALAMAQTEAIECPADVTAIESWRTTLLPSAARGAHDNGGTVLYCEYAGDVTISREVNRSCSLATRNGYAAVSKEANGNERCFIPDGQDIADADLHSTFDCVFLCW